MKKGSIDSIETFGLVDGPGIRTVVFLNGCSLRCKFCHNPEMWQMKESNYTSSEIVDKVLRNKPYFKNNGGVTFSGGEPLLQYDFLLETCKKLKKENIHIAIDTAGIGLGDYKELLDTIDLVLLDIKHITKEGYIDITCRDYLERFMEFVKQLNESGKEVWIRQVVVPGIHDNSQYMSHLVTFIKNNIKNVKRVDFLPYHKLGSEKYDILGVDNPYLNMPEMDIVRCDELYKRFLEDFEK
ncbi:MAG: pyruvate formate-lyase-activating protein [Candidatus Coprovivens sp.]